MNPTPGTTSAANDYQSVFDLTYRGSKPPSFWPLYANKPDPGRTDRWSNLTELTQDQRWQLVAKLIAEGYTIDEEIEGEDIDPFSAMYMRSVRYGQTWEPAGTGQVQSTQVVTPGMFTGPVPPGQIKVSINIADYPAYVAPPSNVPVPPPIQQIPNPVGALRIPTMNANMIGGMFQLLVDRNGVDGYGVGEFWPSAGVGAAQGFTGQWQKQLVFAGFATYWVKVA